MARYEEHRTAFPVNIEEVIYYLDLDELGTWMLERTQGLDRDEMECGDCGDLAMWWVSEIRTVEGYEEGDRGRINSFYCDDCIPEGFVEVWCSWDWTDVEAMLRHGSRPSSPGTNG